MFADELLQLYYNKQIHQNDLHAVYSIWNSNVASVIKWSSSSYFYFRVGMDDRISTFNDQWFGKVNENWYEEETTLELIQLMKYTIDMSKARSGYCFQHIINNQTEMVKILRNIQKRFYKLPLDIIPYDLNKEMRAIYIYTKCNIVQKSRLDRYLKIVFDLLYTLRQSNDYIMRSIASL